MANSIKETGEFTVCRPVVNSQVPIVIIDDQALIRLSVKLSLESSGQITVVGEAGTGASGVAIARESDAQVVLMDLGLPEMDGIEATRQIKETTSKKVVILTSHNDDRSVMSALQAGADGFVLKDTKTEDLLSALFSVAHGASWLEDSIARRLACQLYPLLPSASICLNEDEMRILTMLKAGMGIPEVAHELCLPIITVHQIVINVLRRTAKREKETQETCAIPAIELVEQFEPVMICTRCRARVDGASECPDDGAALFEDPLIGSNLTDRYVVLSLIGVGGNGAVYKARHRYTGKVVAVKVLHAELAQSADLVARFRQEAIAVASLEHQNLVSVSDFGMTNEGIFFMVMDYLEGKSLLSLIRENGPLDYRKALPIFIQVLEGIAVAHEAGIIHRDLKPGNVHILDQEQKGSSVKVLDFGLAKVHSENNIVMTVPGEIFGSPAFMSPEQCRGQTLDMRSDVYSMGCLMYQALTGQLVFVAKSAPEVMYHQIYTAPESFQSINKNLNIPPLIEAVIFKCLEKNANDRFQSIHELKRALSMCAAV